MQTKKPYLFGNPYPSGTVEPSEGAPGWLDARFAWKGLTGCHQVTFEGAVGPSNFNVSQGAGGECGVQRELIGNRADISRNRENWHARRRVEKIHS
jgi:hypothetical protein